jgi:hypothetical protein
VRGAAAGYELAYVEARRALDDQEAAVNDLRSRAGVLIAAAAVTTSFFGGAALADGHLGVAGWLAVVAFVVLGASVLAVLWPRHQWAFNVDAREYIETYLEPDDSEALDVPAIHRDLALHMAESFRANRRHLRSLLSTFRLAAALLIVEVSAWVAALIAQGN